MKIDYEYANMRMPNVNVCMRSEMSSNNDRIGIDSWIIYLKFCVMFEYNGLLFYGLTIFLVFCLSLLWFSVKTSVKSKNKRNWKLLTNSSLLFLENMLGLSVLWVTCCVIITCACRLLHHPGLSVVFFMLLTQVCTGIEKQRKRRIAEARQPPQRPVRDIQPNISVGFSTAFQAPNSFPTCFRRFLAKCAQLSVPPRKYGDIMHVSNQFKAESKKSEHGRKTLEALEVMAESL